MRWAAGGGRACAALVAAVMCAAFPHPGSAQLLEGFNAEGGPRYERVRLRHDPQALGARLLQGNAMGVFGGLGGDRLSVHGDFVRGSLKEGDGTGASRDFQRWGVVLRADMAQWLAVRVGTEQWSLDLDPTLKMTTWSAGGELSWPIARDVVIAHGAAAVTFAGRLRRVGEIGQGVDAHVGLSLAPRFPVAASAYYHLSRQLIQGAGDSAERVERLTLSVGFQLH